MTSRVGVGVRPTVSVLVPSRGRPASLGRSLTLLWEESYLALGGFDERSRFEVIVGLDEDDPEFRAYQDEIGDLEERYGLSVRTVPFEERFGYSQLHRYYNALAERARGTWLLLWNDDALMRSAGWDVTLADLGSAPRAAWLRSNHVPDPCAFPAISRLFYEAMGHWSLSPHCDTWVHDVAARSQTLVMTEIEVFHDRFDLTGGHDDLTAKEAREGYRTAEYLGPENQVQIDRDAEAVRLAVRAHQRGEVFWA